MGKKNKIKQTICNLTENNTAYDDKLEAFEAHCENPKECVAWELDSLQQCIDQKTGHFIQFIGELSFRPIKIYHSLVRSKDTNITAISSQTEDAEMTFLEAGKKKEGMVLWLGISLALVTLTIMVAVYMKMKGG